jgi:hypothetical protein
MARYYRRHLPHGAPLGSIVFVTWNLKGALTASMVRQIAELRSRQDASVEDIEKQRRLFELVESHLDGAGTGPRHLADPRCAAVVSQRLLEGSTEWYDLYAFVVMHNHVHVLLRPRVELERITAGIKKTTARTVNAVLGRTGRSLWQDESFDHRPRSSDKILRAIDYIESNPVKAGLCRSPEQWAWSSAKFRKQWPVGAALGRFETGLE